jgi:hypothetical protein
MFRYAPTQISPMRPHQVSTKTSEWIELRNMLCLDSGFSLFHLVYVHCNTVLKAVNASGHWNLGNYRWHVWFPNVSDGVVLVEKSNQEKEWH